LFGRTKVRSRLALPRQSRHEPPLLFDLRASASTSPVTAAWRARPLCTGWRAKTARSSPLTGRRSISPTRAPPNPAGRAAARRHVSPRRSRGRVGGIYANDTYPADCLVDNLAIALNVTSGSFKAGVGKLLALGSAYIYRKLEPQRITEDALLTGPLEPTDEWYAGAKIAALKMCEAYRRQHGANCVSVMPTNLYGPGDNYDPDDSHVPAARC